MRILVVEDQLEIAANLKQKLERECYAVDVENDGEKGFYRARTNDYDLILLDNVLPGKGGYEICSELRKYKMTTPILILSALTGTDTKVELLNCGADDYLTKPFSYPELSARITALLRRPKTMETGKLVVNELTLDKATYSFTYHGQTTYLTPKEFMLLEYLMKNHGKVVSRAMILDHVWDSNADPFSNTIETHIANIRKKIDAGDKNKLIKTIPGRGYMI